MPVLLTYEFYTISGFHNSLMLMLILLLDAGTVKKWSKLLTYWPSSMFSSVGPYKCWQHSPLLQRTIPREKNHYQTEIHLHPSIKCSLKLNKVRLRKQLQKWQWLEDGITFSPKVISVLMPTTTCSISYMYCESMESILKIRNKIKNLIGNANSGGISQIVIAI
jgi:hypothetical protein